MRRSLFVPLLFATVASAVAQTFPPAPKVGTVFDGANLLTDAEAQTVSDLSRRFERDKGAPIAVATLTSLDRYEAKGMGIAKYSAALFDQWRVGHRQSNGGILLVVAKEDRKIWVALGSAWSHEDDARTQGIVRNTISPLFKQGRFGEGIVQGCNALVRLAETGEATGVSPAQTSPTPVPFEAATVGESAEGNGLPIGFMLVCCGAPILLFAAIVASVRRRRRYGVPYGGYGAGPNVYNSVNDPRDDSGAFLAGMVAGQAMSQPVYDPAPNDPGPGYDSGNSFDSGSFDSGGSDSGSFDSGSSDGGGGGGDW